ncbi:unnamed protein product [Larinioides sclopetarius]|uniref:Uncharacterized protein n=3 Tax=Larinioides sclopetarius TaxID=280406 RepID=A0AAV1ZXV0_9ARAC
MAAMEYGGVPILSLHDANRNKKRHVTETKIKMAAMEYGGVPILSLHDANRNKKHITGKGQSQWNILAPSDIIRFILFDPIVTCLH